jgi:hypothetical protein
MAAPTFQPLTEEAIQRLRVVFKNYLDEKVWVSWKGEQRADGSWSKPPIDPKTGNYVGPNDPLTCSDFETAIAFHRCGKADGIGFNVLETDVVGGDIDDCLNNGEIKPAALEIITRLNTYTERSPSGQGLRFFGVGKGGSVNRKQPVPGANGLKVEVARKANKYFTITGNVLSDYPLALSEKAEIDVFVDEVEGWAKGPKDKKPKGSRWSARHKGRDLDDIIKNGVPKGERSEAVWFVIHAMIRARAKDDAILATLLDRSNKISEHIHDQKQAPEDYARRQIKQARDEIAAKRKSEQEKLLDELNGENAVIMDGGKTWVLRFAEVHHSAGGRQYTFLEPVYLRFQDLRNFYLNRRVNVGDEEKPKWVDVGSWWLEHPDRRQYQGVTFQPGGKKVIDGQLNLWRGWGVEPRKGDWSKLKEHIRVVLCASDKAFYEYVLRWLAWSVQHPDQRAEVALVFLGDRGTGKGTLGNALCTIFGQHQLHASTVEELTGRFNEHLRQCIFMFADEAYGPKDKTAEGELQRKITEPTLRVEGKGKARITVPNYLHVVMASNNDWVIPAGAHERRFAVKRVSDIHRQDKAWFDPLYKQLNEGGYEAMLYDLLNMDVSNWHPRQIVRTAELAEQQEESLTPREEWWFELLQTGVLSGSRATDPSRPISKRYQETLTEVGNYNAGRRRTIWRDGLYESARASTPRLKGTGDAALGRFLSAKEQGCKRTWVNRRRGWQFPPLATCRKAWLARFPDTVWHDPDLTEWRHEPDVGSFDVGGSSEPEK